ncbi:hypothetical protein ALISP_1676 [Alicycliphilus sp. B1]|nr:hypothetical protein ALISP_1676 [Alicycliphilus sp. B1]
MLGSPDPYGKQIDGLGNASSSTSKAVILSRSTRPGHDVDYLFGQVSIDQPFVDWSGNCGNLSAAVGPCAIHLGLIDPARIPIHGNVTVRILASQHRQDHRRARAHRGRTSAGDGRFELDGVAFPAAEVPLEFIEPSDDSGAMFPTGNVMDTLEVPGVGTFQATLINAGIPTIFLNAKDVGCTGTELQGDINEDKAALARFEAIRAHGAVRMGLIHDVAEAAQRQHTPKIVFIAPPASYTASSGKRIAAGDIDLLARALSMGKLPPRP